MNNAVMLAERYGITDKCKALEHALLKIHGATSVEFELNGFLDNIHQVIVLVGYDFHQIRELPTFAREVALEAFQHDLKNPEIGLRTTASTYTLFSIAAKVGLPTKITNSKNIYQRSGTNPAFRQHYL